MSFWKEPLCFDYAENEYQLQNDTSRERPFCIEGAICQWIHFGNVLSKGSSVKNLQMQITFYSHMWRNGHYITFTYINQNADTRS